jgi:hypothetical protein
MIFEQLTQFRQRLYEQLGYAKDALFELMDAVLVSSSIVSFVSLSQSPVFRRQWSSIYAALHDGRVSANQLTPLLTAEVERGQQPLLAGDRTLWPRPEAPTLRERSFGREAGGEITLGHHYSTLAWIPEAQGSWALPLRHERISSFETPLARAAFQLKQVSRALEERPLALYDREYGNGSFVKQTRGISADLLLRLASNRCVWGTPGPYRGRGAPRKHGAKLKFNDPDNWPSPMQTLHLTDAHYGQVKLMHWSGFHFKQTPQQAMEIVRVEVVEPVGQRRKFQVLWLAYVGEAMPELASIWQLYLRRFALEHWYRFAKQRLFWTQPQLSSTQASERWSALMPLLSWQLWLARAQCEDAPLPWQSAQDKLAPGRVATAFASILVAIGTPAQAPKRRGKSPGRAFGTQLNPRPQYPTVKKRAARRKKTEEIPEPLQEIVA